MDRFIVRAELRTQDETIVSYGYDLTPGSVFVVTDWPAPLGTRVIAATVAAAGTAPMELAAHGRRSCSASRRARRSSPA